MPELNAGNWLKVENVNEVKLSQWCGEVQFSGKRFPTKILIFEYDGNLRAIPRLCPHQSYDLIGSDVLEGGVVKCQWHGLPLCITDEKISYAVKRDDQIFYCLETH